MIYLDKQFSKFTINDLQKSSETYTKLFNLSIKNSQYTEDENGNRFFKVNGSFIGKDFGQGGKYWEKLFVSHILKLTVQVENLNGKIIKVFEAGGYMPKFGTIAGVSFNPVPLSQDFSFTIKGIENLPNDIITVKAILRGDNSGVSNVATVTENLVSNLSEETILKRELENQTKLNEIKRELIIPTITPEIDPAVLPSIVASSSLIPLGILAILLLNSSRSKK
tara:strand:- start:77 stop:745 length:669 start_codon:yes stop_codon:yes gene_type:complete